MEKELKRIAVLQTGKMLAILYGFLGLLMLPRSGPLISVWVVLAAASIANAIAAAAVGADLPEYGNALVDHIWPRIIEGRTPHELNAYTLGNVLGLSGLLTLAPLFLFLSLTVPLLHRLSNKAEREATHS